jgi:glycine oxidase
MKGVNLSGKPDVVIVGAGVMGCSAAYWLTKEGYQVLVLEKEAVAVGASGMASAHWLAVSPETYSALEDRRLSQLAWLSSRLHHELASVLPTESGIDIGYLEHPTLRLTFTAEEYENLKILPLALEREDPPARWLEGQALWETEPRVSRDALGALACRQAQVMAYPFVLALAEAAERRGMELRHGQVVGLQNNGRQVTGVRLRNGEIIATETVVLAMGPWSQQACAWVGLRIPIYPVRGQLLELLVPDPQLQVSLSYAGNYLLRKVDGITQAGTTYERDSGFDNHQTPAGLEAIMDAALGMAPSLEEAQLMNHVSGLRPACGDSLPLIGPIPGWQGVYMVAGHDRKGMGLSLISTRIIADLIAGRGSPAAIENFDPARFGPAE